MTDLYDNRALEFLILLQFFIMKETLNLNFTLNVRISIRRSIIMKQKIYSIFHFTCPKCLHGKFFKYHPYNLKHVGEIYESCSCCGLKYEREPGFYFGGMYVSYALSVALFVAFWVGFTLFFPSASNTVQITSIVGTVVILSPIMYALSKIIWANIFFKFDIKSYKECKSLKEPVQSLDSKI